MSLSASLSALRTDRVKLLDELSIPSKPIPLTFVQGMEVRLALDTENCPLLLLPVSTSELGQDLPEAHGLHFRYEQYKGRSTASTYFLQVKCALPTLESVFLDLVENICSRIQDGGNGLECVHATIEEFRDLLRPSTLPIDRIRIIGLFGELLFLKEAIQHNQKAVEHWTGPQGERRDFLFAASAVEIKTSEKSSGSSVIIHSLGQLNNDDSKDLFLWYTRLEEDPGSGASVGDLVDVIESQLVSKTLFREKLRAVGFDKSNADVWNSVHWAVLESQPFQVFDGFPRIIPGSFEAGTPPGISHVNYQLDLSHAKEFKVSADSVMEHINQ